MIKFVHTGDIHLGLQFNNVSFDKETAVTRRNELWSTFQRLVEYTKNNNIDFLFIAGDLFESKYFTLGDMKRLRDILKDAINVNIIISAGNHDYLNKDSLYNKVDWSENVFIYNGDGVQEIDFPDLDTVIYGYSWDRVEIKENRLIDNYDFQSLRSNKILLIHGDIGNNSNYLPLSLDSLNRLNLDYIALGHIHKPQLFSNKVAYCGSLEPLDFGEIGDRGFIEGYIENNETKIEFIDFSKRKFLFKSMYIDENMSYQDIFNLIKSVEGNKGLDYYRIELNGYIQHDIDINSLFALLKNEFYYIEIIDNTTPDYDLEALENDYKDSIIGEFIREMKKKGLTDPIVKQALYFGLDALLKGRVDS
ncbi:MAG: metallophosphoesterase [Tissierellaceae bacterium]|nr:metallophosphoesterase [Tissierellaceae bacterium]